MNPYKDKEGHWTTKENDGGECKHGTGAGAKRLEGKQPKKLTDNDFDENMNLKSGKSWSEYFDARNDDEEDLSSVAYLTPDEYKKVVDYAKKNGLETDEVVDNIYDKTGNRRKGIKEQIDQLENSDAPQQEENTLDNIVKNYPKFEDPTNLQVFKNEKEATDYIEKYVKDPDKKAKYQRALEEDRYNNSKGYSNDYYETYESILNDIEDEYYDKEEEYLSKNEKDIEKGLIDLAKKGATDEELANKLNETKLKRSNRYFNLSTKGYIDNIRNKAEGFETPDRYMSVKDQTSTLRGDFKKLGYKPSQIGVRGSTAGYSDVIRITIKDPTIDKDKIERIANRFESYDIDDVTGEILQGGNTYVQVDYDYDMKENLTKEYTPKVEKMMQQIDKNVAAGGTNTINLGEKSYLYKDGQEFYFYNGERTTRVWSPEQLAEYVGLLDKQGKIKI